MPITSGERLTIAPNEKSQNAGRSMTLTGTPAFRAAAANCAAALSFGQSAIAMAAPVKSAAVQFRCWIMTALLGGAPASANMSSLGSKANTSTCAPAADKSSAFQVAAALPPATTARLPLSAKNAGSRDSGAIRTVPICLGALIMAIRRI
jgi:hypothetical protein